MYPLGVTGVDQVDFAFACDLMMDLGGSIRPAMYLANELISKGHHVSMITPLMSESVEESLLQKRIEPINLRARFIAKHMGIHFYGLRRGRERIF